MSPDGVFVDKSFTIVATAVGLIVGVIGALVLGGITLFIRSLIAAPVVSKAGATFSVVSLLLPLAVVLSLGSMIFGVFQLPVRFAKRRGVILDPDIFPFYGAIILGVLLTLAFVAAIYLRII